MSEDRKMLCDPDFLADFKAEVELCLSLRHPNIVQVPYLNLPYPF